MADRSKMLRAHFARLMASQTKNNSAKIEKAFSEVRREIFAGPGPWTTAIMSGRSYVKTPDDDIAFLYQDTIVLLDPERGISIGLPSAHAIWLDAANIKDGETVTQIGAGSGYYTAILADLVGDGGRVHTYEIDAGLASRATINLSNLPHVTVHTASGTAEKLAEADVVYACIGVHEPRPSWLRALRPGGRLVVPLQPEEGLGGMLMIMRAADADVWPARFLTRAHVALGDNKPDAETSRRLKDAFARDVGRVRSFRLGCNTDDSCWFAGNGWWLSTREQ